MRPFYPIVIIGAGMAGLAAANTLSGNGYEILIIDENDHIGGQLLRTRDPIQPGGWSPDPMKSIGFDLIKRLKTAKDITVMPRAEVLGILPDRRLLVHTMDRPDTCKEIRAGRLILATGARERYLPFPGWTLPGVMSLGAAQILMKHHGVLPAADTLIAGSSPLMMVLAAELLANGGKVAGLADEKGMKDKAAFLPFLRHHWPKLLEGGWYTGRMIMGRVNQYPRTRVITATGNGRFKTTVLASIDPKGRIIPGTEMEIQAGALTVGYGFAPNIELGVQAGCRTGYKPSLGGWVLETPHSRYETSVPGIYAAGEPTGVGGAKKSWIDGRLAAMGILKSDGKVPAARHKQRFDATRAHLRRQAEHQLAYAGFLNRLTALPDAAYTTIPDETLICRCEAVTMGDIRKRITQGFDTPAVLKKATRCGMGRCQGRICGPVTQDIIRVLTANKPDAPATGTRARVPVKPVPAAALFSSKENNR
ncbi:MAG TPA: FAD/NAD(P)-binding oxidoreductase [Desulfobacteraceae bacterium]|nr:FAD/NAD(P)-binding oxidoreductase [Desulfobacteraceae bacterium]